MVRLLKAVITCGGIGSRLLPFTKELPKEMAPIFYNTKEGVLIVDDYETWLGSKKATDEYLEKNNVQIFLNRINPSGAIIGVKM